jgi:hypothetical protein
MKTRTEILPSLHPNTVAALVGHFTIQFAPDGSVTGTVTARDMSATYQARNVCAELVELVLTVRACKGIDTLAESYQDALSKLGRVAKIAVAIDDHAFPMQLAFAMKYASDAKTPRRRAVFMAWRHLTSGCTITDHKSGRVTVLRNPSKADLHALCESAFGDKITARTLDDDLAEMKLSGYQKRVRGNR